MRYENSEGESGVIRDFFFFFCNSRKNVDDILGGDVPHLEISLVPNEKKPGLN